MPGKVRKPATQSFGPRSTEGFRHLRRGFELVASWAEFSIGLPNVYSTHPYPHCFTEGLDNVALNLTEHRDMTNPSANPSLPNLNVFTA